MFAVKDRKMLKERFPGDEYEKLVIGAYSWGDVTDSIMEALADLGTPAAVEQLIDAGLNNDRRSVTLLVSLGCKAHSALLGVYRMTAGPPDWVTTRRKFVLSVLEQSGDKDCVATIAEVAKQDASIAEQAAKTLTAIARREQGAVASPDLAPKPMTVRTPPATGDPYIDSCFTCNFKEEYEPRRWDQMDDLRAIRQLLDAGEFRRAHAPLKAAMERYPDYDVLYCWLAEICGKLGKSVERITVMKVGLRKSRRKAWLCAKLAMAAFEADDLVEAVKWWIKSCAIQLGGGRAEDASPFLNLAYVAEGLGLGVAKTQFLRQADAMDNRQVRLNDKGANERYRVTSAQGNASVKQAVSLLCSFYL
jgi:hypothetical protein